MSASPLRDGFTLNETMIETTMEHTKGHFDEGELNFDFMVRKISESKFKTAKETLALEIYSVEFGPIPLLPQVKKQPRLAE